MNDTITVIYTAIPDQVFVFSGNFSDGYRHFFQATFAKKDNLRIVIDSIKHYFSSIFRLHLATAVSFRFGGHFDSQEIFDGYHGCLSNVDLDFHRNSKTVFQPLISYFNASINTSQYLIVEPDPKIVLLSKNCGQFFVPGILPSKFFFFFKLHFWLQHFNAMYNFLHGMPFLLQFLFNPISQLFRLKHLQMNFHGGFGFFSD